MILWGTIWASLLSLGVAQLSSNPEELRDWCLDSKHHKKKPGPEDKLHAQCIPWKDRACCTSETSFDIHKGQMYNFNYNHCPGKTMSNKCREHFTQDHCFFECEPNLGPWVVKIDMKTRNETIHGVPLCADDCDIWYNHCKDDYTCTSNWLKGFDWKNGENVCRQTDECKPFREIFRNAAHFCEMVWDESWKYTDPTKPCMRLWFDGTIGNPNDAVAEQRILELLQAGSPENSPSHSRGIALKTTCHSGVITIVSILILLSINF